MPTGARRPSERYELLMPHYGLEPTTNNLGVAHENGDVEQEHRRFKRAVDQALRVRGSRDFRDRSRLRALPAATWSSSATSPARRAGLEERAGAAPAARGAAGLCREVRVPVSRFSTIQVLRNTYSVPSRLIGTTLLVRVRSETLEVYRGTDASADACRGCSAMASTASTTATSSGRWCASPAPSPTTATATICSPA